MGLVGLGPGVLIMGRVLDKSSYAPVESDELLRRTRLPDTALPPPPYCTGLCGGKLGSRKYATVMKLG